MSYKQTPLKDREGNILLPETIAAAVTDPALGKTQAEINAETITRVELVCDDDQHITLIDDPTPLTYAQVKALVDDTTKFVTLRYLDMWWMLPSYDDGGAIMFTSSDIQGGHVIVTRVILNDDGQMNNYSIVAEDAEHKTDDMSVETAADGHRTYPTTHAVNGALATKANTDGYYTELTSGMAEQLLSPDGITDEEPYIYRTSAGSTSISTGVAQVEKLEGNSIVWNQLNKKQASLTTVGITQVSTDDEITTINGTATADVTIFNVASTGALYQALPNGHKGLFKYTVISGTFNGTGIWTYGGSDSKSFSSNTEFIRTSSTQYEYLLQHIKQGDTFNNFKFRFQVFDLTQMFGEGNEPTIEQFKQWFPLDYYEYNEGEIINVNINGLKTVGFNAYNNGVAKVIANKQYQITGAYTSVKYSDGTDVVIEGGFFTPTKNDTIAIAGGGADTCVHLVWSGYRNGDYEPYQEHNISIPVKEIKDADNNLLFPDGLLSAGSVKDEVTSDKAIKRIGVVDLGSLNWVIISQTEYIYYITRNLMDVMKATSANQYADVPVLTLRTKGTLPWNAIQKEASEGYGFVSADARYCIQDSNFASVESFKASLQGQYLYYELATPIEVDFKDTPQTFGEKLNLTYFVDDFGTEEFTTDSTNIVAPVAHSTFYMTNLRDKIRNIDGNTDAGALMNGSVDNLLTTLGTALGGTLTKTWDATNKKWMFSFAPNATNLNEEGGEQ